MKLFNAKIYFFLILKQKAKEFAKKITKLNIKAEPKVKKQESVPKNLNIPSSVGIYIFKFIQSPK